MEGGSNHPRVYIFGLQYRLLLAQKRESAKNSMSAHMWIIKLFIFATIAKLFI